MKTIRIFSVVTLLTAVLLCSCQTNESSFVSVKDGKFTSKDYPSHFLGTNFWYGAIASDQDTEVCQTVFLEDIQFFFKTFQITALTIGSQNGTVPEVGAKKV